MLIRRSFPYSVRRDEILSPPSSSAPSSPKLRPEDDQQARALLGKLLGFDTFTVDIQPDATTATTKDHEDNDATLETSGAKDTQEEDEEQEFEFRLFSAPAATTTAAQKASKSIVGNESAQPKTQKLRIRVRSPSPGDTQPGEGRLVVPFRGWQYYVTTPQLMKLTPSEQQHEVDNVKRKQYEDIAVTGAQILHWARTAKTPGCHLPWRVTHLKPSSVRTTNSSTQLATVLVTTHESSEKTKKKSKPGKKRRIILRKRAEKTNALAGMTDAEKRNKKNRERKIKRRQKEREKKAALALATENTANASGSPDVEENSGSE
jgi:hypothetical protein